MERKKAKARGKTDMSMIENDDDRYITFSKRKSGIFKKASQLVILCGAEIGIVIFSPTGKPYSFGHPSFDSIAKRFQNQNQNPPANNNPHALVEAHLRNRMIQELNEQVNELYSRIEREEERKEQFKKLTDGRLGKNWFDKPIDDLSFKELEKMNDSLEKLYQNICTQGNIFAQVTNPLAATSSLNISKMVG